MLRMAKGIWILALALALLASAPGQVQPVWADPDGNIGDDPGGGGIGDGGGRGDPDQPIGGYIKGGMGGSYSRPSASRFGQFRAPNTVDARLLRAQLLMRWIKLALYARGL